MYNGKKVLAFIPARKGSKRLKNKNMLKINNIPLFQYSVEVAKKSKYIDDILVSTDSEEILSLAHSLGCIKNELRPDELSQDTSRIIDAIIYEIEKNNLKDYSAVVLLQPTSPYRKETILDSAIRKYFETETSLITVVESKEQPIFLRTIKNEKLEKIVNDTSDIRSQEFKKIYRIVGSIYINNINKINPKTVLNENEVPFIIDEEYFVDIDTYEDFKNIKEKLEI